MRIDAVALEPRQRLLAAKVRQRLQNLAFEALHHFERDIEEIPGSAGWIEHARRAELVVESAHSGERVPCAALGLLALSGRDDIPPVRAQRFDDSSGDKPLDIGAGRVMRAQLAALVRVQRLLQKRAEDRRVHVAPIVAGRLAQLADFLASERKSGAIAKKFAVEAQNLLAQRMSPGS